MAALDLLVVGDVDVDIYLRVPRLPDFGEKVRGELLGLRPGGVAANVAVAARRLGLMTGVHGIIGDDEHGRFTRAALVDEGVDLGALHVDPSATTFLCVVHLDDTGEKALTLADTGTLFPPVDGLDVAAVRGASHVHVAPFDIDAAIRALQIAKEAGASTSVDLEPGSIGGGLVQLAPLLANADVCFVNHHAAAELAPGGDVRDAIAAIQAHGPDIVVLTAGADGAVVSSDGEIVEVAGVAADVVDSTGAGDAFCAAFLAELQAGRSAVVAARTAVVAGALACRGIGAQTAAPTRAELDAAVADHARSGTPPTDNPMSTTHTASPTENC